jgi:hypothetical protein
VRYERFVTGAEKSGLELKNRKSRKACHPFTLFKSKIFIFLK